jgi:hypothetical protein
MKYNLDIAYTRVGEFGRAQWLLTFVNSVARNGGCYMYYPFAYLVLEQQFLCGVNSVLSQNNDVSSFYIKCSAAEICLIQETNPSYSDFKVDTSYSYYLNNWYL